eukprot:6192115-Pleurochrysis_carterae.AAC.1
MKRKANQGEGALLRKKCGLHLLRDVLSCAEMSPARICGRERSVHSAPELRPRHAPVHGCAAHSKGL